MLSLLGPAPRRGRSAVRARFVALVLLVAVASALVLATTAHAAAPATFGVIAEQTGPGRLLPEGRAIRFADATVSFPDGGQVIGDVHSRGAGWKGPGRCERLLVADASLFLTASMDPPKGTPATATIITEDGTTRREPAHLMWSGEDSLPGVWLAVELPADLLSGLPLRRFVAVNVTGIVRTASCERRLKPLLQQIIATTTVQLRAPFVAPPPLDLPPAVDLRTRATATVGGTREFDHVGQQVVALGDVDGDRRTDLAVNHAAGTVVLAAPQSGTLGLDDREATIMRLRGVRSIAAAGDVDGDGRDDIVVGRPGEDARRGVVQVLRGRPRATKASAPVLQVVGPRRCAGLGEHVGWAGDVDGDGHGDLVVSSETCGRRPSSSAWLVYGGSGRTRIDLRHPADRAVSLSGLPHGGDVDVAGVGDVNGDGLADIVVGAPFFTGGGATVVFGQRERTGVDLRTPGSRGIRVEGAECEEIGGVVAPGGDVNGDGLADVLLTGEHVCDGGPFRWDGAYVLFGGDAGVVSTSALGPRGQRLDGLDTYLRHSVIASAGDQNGDGLDDVLISDGREVLMVPGRREPGDISLRTLSDAGQRYVGVRHGILGLPGFAVLPDVDGDRRPELAFGSPGAQSRGAREAGRVLIVPSSRLAP